MAQFFGNSPEFWLNLQQMHDLSKARLELSKTIEREVEAYAGRKWIWIADEIPGLKREIWGTRPSYWPSSSISSSSSPSASADDQFSPAIFCSIVS